MKNIEVHVLDSHKDPGGMMMFLAKLTQRGHKIKDMKGLVKMLNNSGFPDPEVVERVAALPHGTIKRFTPITIAIVGASRRFLAQARTNQVGFNYVSASLQYSDYSGEADFVVPYALTEKDAEFKRSGKPYVFLPSDYYLRACEDSMDAYKEIAEATDNDTAGYAAPQGLRNILIMQGNHQAWQYFIQSRACNRNTNETQYVALRIWEELLKTEYGAEFFKYAGPTCVHGKCLEGKMACGNPMKHYVRDADICSVSIPRQIINTQWPLLGGEELV